jgi:hypothetical protein
MKLTDLLQHTRVDEAPLGVFQTVGDFSKEGTWDDKRDRRLVTNPVSVQKMHDAFAKTPFTFDMFLVNTPTTFGRPDKDNRWEGEISLSTARKLFPPDYDDVFVNYIKSKDYDHQAIILVHTHNGGDEKVPFTPWIMAHRTVHAITGIPEGKDNRLSLGTKLFSNIEITTFDIPRDNYGINVTDVALPDRKDREAFISFWSQVATMRSARRNTVTRAGEYMIELMTQYLVTGKVTLNGMPDMISYNGRKYRWTSEYTGHNREQANSIIKVWENQLDEMFEVYMSTLPGRVFKV